MSSFLLRTLCSFIIKFESTCRDTDDVSFNGVPTDERPGTLKIGSF